MKFVKYEVVPLKDHSNPAVCGKREAEFWGLFGIDENSFAWAIGDFNSKNDAELIRDALLKSAF